MFKPIFYSLVLPLAIALVGCSDNNEVINMEKWSETHNGPSYNTSRRLGIWRKR